MAKVPTPMGALGIALLGLIKKIPAVPRWDGLGAGWTGATRTAALLLARGRRCDEDGGVLVTATLLPTRNV